MAAAKLLHCPFCGSEDAQRQIVKLHCEIYRALLLHRVRCRHEGRAQKERRGGAGSGGSGVEYATAEAETEGGAMSVLIKGMRMPESCADCAFYDVAWNFCAASGKKVDPARARETRAESCPLTEVSDREDRPQTVGTILEALGENMLVLILRRGRSALFYNTCGKARAWAKEQGYDDTPATVDEKYGLWEIRISGVHGAESESE